MPSSNKRKKRKKKRKKLHSDLMNAKWKMAKYPVLRVMLDWASLVEVSLRSDSLAQNVRR
jgi:hypothetical protein